MATTPLATIKSWFTTGSTPTKDHFWAWMDSFFHKDELIPVNKVQGLDELISRKAEAEAFDYHTDKDLAELMHTEVQIKISGTYDLLDGVIHPTQANMNDAVDKRITDLLERIQELEQKVP